MNEKIIIYLLKLQNENRKYTKLIVIKYKSNKKLHNINAKIYNTKDNYMIK